MTPVWDVAADGNPFSVRQIRNANPSVFDLAGNFVAAPVAFYNQSQESTIYRNLTIEPLD